MGKPMKCIFCKEEVHDEAIKCKHCGSMLNSDNASSIDTNINSDKQIWNPSALVYWSVLISPFVAMWYHSKNWQQLSLPNKAKTSRKWLYISIGLCILFIASKNHAGEVTTSSYWMGFVIGNWISFLLPWYFFDAKKQIDYVKKKSISSKKSLLAPISIGLIITFVLMSALSSDKQSTTQTIGESKLVSIQKQFKSDLLTENKFLNSAAIRFAENYIKELNQIGIQTSGHLRCDDTYDFKLFNTEYGFVTRKAKNEQSVNDQNIIYKSQIKAIKTGIEFTCKSNHNRSKKPMFLLAILGHDTEYDSYHCQKIINATKYNSNANNTYAPEDHYFDGMTKLEAIENHAKECGFRNNKRRVK